MATVSFQGVTRRFPGATRNAVDALDLEIRDGEFLVLVGPSGCGKTTTLRMLAGLDPVDEGTVLIGDADVTDVAPKDRDIAMVFQNYALYPHMSVEDNMGFGLKTRGVPKAERAERVREAAGLLDLENLLHRHPAELSGGQRQRVAMGRAIVREPQVFLMDEPLSNLDAKLRVQTRAQIASLQRRLGTTTVYVTHDQTEAMTMGDRIAVLDEGRLQQLGSPQELYRRPANEFVAPRDAVAFLYVNLLNTSRRAETHVDFANGLQVAACRHKTEDVAPPDGNNRCHFSCSELCRISRAQCLHDRASKEVGDDRQHCNDEYEFGPAPLHVIHHHALSGVKKSVRSSSMPAASCSSHKAT